MRASSVCWVGSRMSRRRLCVRISNCSRDFLSTCGERLTVKRETAVGRGIGPATLAPVRRAVSIPHSRFGTRIGFLFGLLTATVLTIADAGVLPDGVKLPFDPKDRGQGFNSVLTTTHRQNFLVPPRVHRSFPLAEFLK